MSSETLLDWMLDKHRRMAMVIPVASKNPWKLHDEENVCIGCLPTFVSEYLADVPAVMTEFEARELIEAGVLREEFDE